MMRRAPRAPPEPAAQRPQTRGECQRGRHAQRPCPFVGCKHHLYLDVNPETGTIKFNFPDIEPDELEHSCSLDLADDGEHDLQFIADRLNTTPSRIHQIVRANLRRLRRRASKSGLR